MFTNLVSRLRSRDDKIAVMGLGYVGLPLAVAFAKSFDVIGYDNNAKRLELLSKGVDETGEINNEDLNSAGIAFSSDEAILSQARFICVTVPTPVDSYNHPDLSPIKSASAAIGRCLQPGTVVVYESTVYPGVTEDICVEIIENESGLKNGKDFKVGYSPERINPGDKEHTIEKIVKVVSGQDRESLEIVAGVYGEIITAGIYKAPTIKVAEAAKVIENIQRDINIALINELAIIFQKLDIRTSDVLKAAGTKWNFLGFRPGLVGGHCIGVDPYYLTTKAEEVGYHPQIILAGRRINDGMSSYVVEQVIKKMIKMGKQVKAARIGLFGITFKENVPDLRNSRSPDIFNELQGFHTKVLVHDPVCDPEEAMSEYGISLSPLEDMVDLDVCLVAVTHQQYIELGSDHFITALKGGGGIVADLKSVFQPESFVPPIEYWSL